MCFQLKYLASFLDPAERESRKAESPARRSIARARASASPGGTRRALTSCCRAGQSDFGLRVLDCRLVMTSVVSLIVLRPSSFVGVVVITARACSRTAMRLPRRKEAPSALGRTAISAERRAVVNFRGGSSRVQWRRCTSPMQLVIDVMYARGVQY